MADASRGEEFRDDLRPLARAQRGVGQRLGAAHPDAGRARAADRALRSALARRGAADRRRDRAGDRVRRVGVAEPLARCSPCSSIGVAAARALHPRARGGALPAVSRPPRQRRGRPADRHGGAISMCTYRVIHRLHHNNLYTDDDPDTAIHGGYPRGTAYLWKKLGAGRWSAGTPGRRSPTSSARRRSTTTRNARARPLDDTSPQLRRAARDRPLVRRRLPAARCRSRASRSAAGAAGAVRGVLAACRC